jgi:AraC-like DNA-binding protein
MWRWSLSPLFEADALEPERRPDFLFHSQSYIYGNMSLGRVQASAAHFRRRTHQIARSGNDQIMVVVYDQGGFQLRADRKEAVGRPHDVAIFDLHRKLELSTEASASIACLLPRPTLESLTTGLDHMHGMIIPFEQDLNGLLRTHMQFLLAQAREFLEHQRLNFVQSMVHMLAWTTGDANLAQEWSAEAVLAARFCQVRQSIETHLPNPALGPKFLSNMFQLSRAPLYRMFEPVGGIAAYILQRRFMRAHRDLSDPARFHERVGDMARRLGFSEHPAFSPAYKRKFGVQPTETRATAMHSYRAARGRTSIDAASFHALNHWLSGAANRNT